MRGLISVLVGAVMLFSSTATGAILPPSPYLSVADSPFSGQTFQYFYLENFETGGLSVPGVTVSSGQVFDRGWTNDSVDADDGIIDGYGQSLSLWSGFGVQSLRFSFDASVLGSLPTHVGIVWTDVGWSDEGIGYGRVVFEAFDKDGNSIGAIGPVSVGDGLYGGETAEDRFFGAVYLDGVSAFEISMPNTDPYVNWEVDHLQYGLATVPEPASLIVWSLLGTLGIAFGWRRRKVA